MNIPPNSDLFIAYITVDNTKKFPLHNKYRFFSDCADYYAMAIRTNEVTRYGKKFLVNNLFDHVIVRMTREDYRREYEELLREILGPEYYDTTSIGQLLEAARKQVNLRGNVSEAVRTAVEFELQWEFEYCFSRMIP